MNYLYITTAKFTTGPYFEILYEPSNDLPVKMVLEIGNKIKCLSRFNFYLSLFESVKNLLSCRRRPKVNILCKK